MIDFIIWFCIGYTVTDITRTLVILAREVVK